MSHRRQSFSGNTCYQSVGVLYHVTKSMDQQRICPNHLNNNVHQIKMCLGLIAVPYKAIIYAGIALTIFCSFLDIQAW